MSTTTHSNNSPYKRQKLELSGGISEIIYIQTNDQNSLTGDNMIALENILKDIRETKEIKGAIIASENEKFYSNGLDADNLLATPRERLLEQVGGIVRLFSHIVQFDKPLIAEVSGYAMGGGAVITVGCDFKYMLDSKARIGFTEVNVGLPLPGSFIDRIKACVSPRYWSEVILEGTVYKAKEAKEIGLIDEIADTREDLRKLTTKKLDALTKIPQSAYQSTKNINNATLIQRLPYYEKEIADAFNQPIVMDNLLEAMRALKEKRRPVFK